MTMDNSIPTNGNYILIVASDYELGHMLTEVIKQETFCRVVIATDAYQAVTMIEESKPALLVLDYEIDIYCSRPFWIGSITMSDYLDKLKHHPRIDGIDLYNELRKYRSLEDMSAILVTNYREEYMAAKKHGIPHCERGFDIDRFSQLIEENLKIHVPLIETLVA